MSLAKALAQLDAIVHTAPATSRSARLDVALSEDIDDTLSAIARAIEAKQPFILVSRLSAVANRSGLHPEQLPVLDAHLDLDAEIAACREAVSFTRLSTSFADHLSREADDTKRE